MLDLTLQDPTQRSLLPHLLTTEQLLEKAAAKASGRSEAASIIAMPDLGLPNNVSRIHGGFYTGAVYIWTSGVPIVPIDATVNVCSVSVFRVSNVLESNGAFLRMIESAVTRSKRDSYYDWNFSVGNHFITYGKVSGCTELADGYYLVLHSSASEFKNRYNGLYPSFVNWFSKDIKTLTDARSGRYIRYIEGVAAERFFNKARMLEQFNYQRHQDFAGMICGEEHLIEEISNRPHYGMPTASSIAIGCQWFTTPELFLLLTAPHRPLYFVRPRTGAENVWNDAGEPMLLFPHGLGKQAVEPLDIGYLPDVLSLNGLTYGRGESLQNDQRLRLRDIPDSDQPGEALPSLITSILAVCPGEVVGKIDPIYSYDRIRS